MLAPIQHLLAKKRIVLASSSPRRQELIKLVGIKAVELCPSKFEENLKPSDFKEFSQFVEETALGKADEVYNRLQSSGDDNIIVIAADTMVTLDDEIYGKPKDPSDAIRMLTNLSGRCNRVYTGVVLKSRCGVRKFTEMTDVYFDNLTQEQIEAYVETKDPLDKAGSYGIYGMAASMISKINGDFYCVMGLPLHRLCVEISELIKKETANKPEK